MNWTVEEKKEHFVIEFAENKIIDFKEIFGNDNPLHMEIGCGHGDFLVEKSLKNPNVNFLGIEPRWRRVNSIMKKINHIDNNNVRIVSEYVDKSITNFISANIFERIYIIHPDPWPKRRHHKNRLIQQNFLDALSSLLQKDGIVQISTDHTGYSEWMMKEFSRHKDFECHKEELQEDRVITFFEKVKEKEGFPPIFMWFKKVL